MLIKGTDNDIRSYIERSSKKIFIHGVETYVGFGYAIPSYQLNRGSAEDRSVTSSAFSLHITTETRITDSDPANSINFINERPQHPIHILYGNASLEGEISQLFKLSFGSDLIVLRSAGSSIPLMVGEKSKPSEHKNNFDEDYMQDVLKNFSFLHYQGDEMRSFVSVILPLIAMSTHSVLFVDEPEAFLHPPQARLIGKYVSNLSGHLAQKFLATHSAEVLRGALEAKGKMPRIVRLQRVGDVNHVKELSVELTRQIAQDILLRTSGVYSAIFHERAIVCESEADTLFYSSILDLESVSGTAAADVIFLHGGSKQRLAKLAGTCKQLGVPTSVIVDIDILDDQKIIRSLGESVGVNWNDIKDDWRSIFDSVNSKKLSWLPSLIAETIKGFVAKLELSQLDAKTFLEHVKELFGRYSAWDAVKQSGREALKGGEVIAAFDRLSSKLSAHGVWIVPVGELEGFCRTVPPKGGRWVEEVLTTKDLSSGEDLAEARGFVRKIWSTAPTAV